MIGTYQTVILVLLIIEFLLINFFLLAANDFNNVLTLIPPTSLYPSGQYPNYVSFEKSLAYIFNELFFGASTTCGTFRNSYDSTIIVTATVVIIIIIIIKVV